MRKSSPTAVEFPAGDWKISFKLKDTNDPWTFMGYLNLVSSESSIEHYVGAIEFDDNSHFGEVANKPFPANIISFDPQDGAIYFQILGAATLYNPNTPVPYQFFFEGTYAYDDDTKKMELSGEGKVPFGFCPRSGPPGDEGDTVKWRSGGPTDPPHKPSK
ncbi:MAG: hypothetical protein ACREA2_19470 [Blastocatellia bacterium]